MRSLSPWVAPFLASHLSLSLEVMLLRSASSSSVYRRAVVPSAMQAVVMAATAPRGAVTVPGLYVPRVSDVDRACLRGVLPSWRDSVADTADVRDWT